MRKNIAIAVCALVVGLARLALPSASVSAQAPPPTPPLNPISISGLVTDFDPAYCGRTGAITIAGVSMAIDGINLGFGVDRLIVLPTGELGFVQVAAEPSEVIGTSRRINAYITQDAHIQAWINTQRTTQRTFDITGPVQEVSPSAVRVNGLRFQIEPGVPIPDGLTVGSTVRVTGTLNTSNQINSISVDPDPYTRATFCGGVRSLTPSGQTLSGSVDGVYQCQISIGSLAFEGPTIRLSPSLNIPGVSGFRNQCFNLVFDQFNLATSGSSMIPGTGNRLCGLVTSFTAATPLAPGSIRIGGVTFGIASGVTLTGQNLVTLDANVCLTPSFDPFGSTDPVVGNFGPPPPRAGDLLNGSGIVLQ